MGAKGFGISNEIHISIGPGAAEDVFAVFQLHWPPATCTIKKKKKSARVQHFDFPKHNLSLGWCQSFTLTFSFQSVYEWRKHTVGFHLCHSFTIRGPFPQKLKLTKADNPIHKVLIWFFIITSLVIVIPLHLGWEVSYQCVNVITAITHCQSLHKPGRGNETSPGNNTSRMITTSQPVNGWQIKGIAWLN